MKLNVRGFNHLNHYYYLHRNGFILALISVCMFSCSLNSTYYSNSFSTDDTDVIQEIDTLDKLKLSSVSAGGSTTCGIEHVDLGSERRVYCVGNNEHKHQNNLTQQGLLGSNSLSGVYSNSPVLVTKSDGTALSGAIMIANGEAAACAIVLVNIAGDKQVFCWGSNEFGQLGNTETLTPFTDPPPSAVQNYASAVLTAPNTPLQGDITNLSAGLNHFCATMQNKVYCWGDNQHLQTGLAGSITVNPTATEVTFETLPTTPSTATSPNAYVRVNVLALGRTHSCSLATLRIDDVLEERILCWGRNFKGVLGRNSPSTPPGLLFADHIGVAVKDETNSVVTDINILVSSANSVCALKEGELRLLCWGDNQFNQLGVSNESGQPTFKTAAILMELDHTSAQTAAYTGKTFSSPLGHTICFYTRKNTFTLGEINFEIFCQGVAAHRGGATYSEVEPVQGTKQILPVYIEDQDNPGDLFTEITIAPFSYYALNRPTNLLSSADWLSDHDHKVSLGLSHGCTLSKTGEAVCWGHNFRNRLGGGANYQYIDGISGFTSTDPTNTPFLFMLK